MPDEFVVRLSKGASLRGIVKNEKGEPVQGARIDGRPANELVQSDAPGRSQVDDVRPGNKYEVKAIHPDYVGNEVGGGWSSQKVTAAVGITEVPAIILRRGIPALVRVTILRASRFKVRRDLGRQTVTSGADTAALTMRKAFAVCRRFPMGRCESAWCSKTGCPIRRGQHRAEHASGRFSTATRQETADSFVDRAASPPWRFRFNRTLARRSQPRVERERRREVNPEHL